MKKCWHIYKARTDVLGYAIGRKGWMELEEEDEMKASEVKKKIV